MPQPEPPREDLLRQLREREQQVRNLLAYVDLLGSELNKVYASRSWRAMGLARAVMTRLRRGNRWVTAPVEAVLARLGLAAQGGAGGDYAEWVRRYDTLSDAEREAIAGHLAGWSDAPEITVLMPLHLATGAALASLRAQNYGHWRLWVWEAEEAPPDAVSLRGAVERAAAEDARIRLVSGGGPGAIDALIRDVPDGLAAFWGTSGELAPTALYQVADAARRRAEAELFTVDADTLDAGGVRGNPHFKPAWNPEQLMAQNLVGDLLVLRQGRARALAAARPVSGHCPGYDLALRACDALTAEQAQRLPFPLFHRQPGAGRSTVDARMEQAVLEAHLRETEPGARVEENAGCPGTRRVRHAEPDPLPLVSLIVPTRDRVGLLRNLVPGLLHRTDYPALELLILDNQSAEPSTRDYFAEIATDPRVRVIPHDAPFNYSAINNAGVRHAKGQVVALLNNDLEVLDDGWLRELAGQAMRPSVGAVGARLLYPNRTLQHAGMVLGLGGVAGHVYRGKPVETQMNWGQAQVAREVSACTGACLVLRREVYQQAGGLDESLGVAFNDVDLCLRLRARGLRVVWTPHATLLHLESMTRGPDNTARQIVRYQRELHIMLSRWGAQLLDDPAYNPNLSLEREDGSLAFPPRVRPPWVPEDPEDTAG